MKEDNHEELAEVLNDLVRINNDRIQGYEKAIEESTDGNKDLVELFSRMIDESRQYKAELIGAIQAVGGEVIPEETTGAGKLYRFWMDVKGAVTGKDRESVLDDCEFGEDAAQKAYQHAIESEVTTSADIRRLIVNQRSSLKTSHDAIRRMRDAQEEANELKNGRRSSTY